MPQLFQLPQVVALSTAGVRLPGAKLYFTQSGTSTAQNTYTDIALSVAHSNPVVADASGEFDPIYLDPSLPNYRVKLTTSADVQVFQIDDVPSNNNEGVSFRITGDAPELILEEEDASVNNGKWSVRANSETLVIAGLNDAETVRTALLSIARDGEITVTTIGATNLTATSINGGPLSSGTWTPTVTNGTNLTGTPTVSEGQYIRVGDVVTASVLFIVESSGANASTACRVSLPVASDIAAGRQAIGAAVVRGSTDNNVAGSVLGNSVNDDLDLVFPSTTAELKSVFLTFTYLVN
jgi:hypothetical protein